GEPRGAPVEGQDVRVAVDAHRAWVGRVEGAGPGAGRRLTDAGAPGVRDGARVAAGRVQPGPRASAHLGGLTVGADVELTVQARCWIVGDQVQREALGQRRAEPLRGLEPGPIARTGR